MPKKQLLRFISNEDLYSCTLKLVNAGMHAQNNKNIYRNVLDPFSALLEASIMRVPLSQWLVAEKTRQTQKSLQNAIGNFHQEIIGAIDGWENLGIGSSYDVKSSSKKIIAEIKNKYNTLNSEGFVSVYHKLARNLDYGFRGQGYTGYLVTIIPKTSTQVDCAFTPPENGVRLSAREDLRIIDGKSFYAKVTGDPDALENLYKVLPHVLSDIMLIPKSELISGEDFMDLFNRAYN